MTNLDQNPDFLGHNDPLSLSKIPAFQPQNIFAPPLNDELYARAYRLRRAASSMTPAAIQWFQHHGRWLIENSITRPDPSNVFSVLSVGCGEGDVDLAIIRSLIPHIHHNQLHLHYTAIEPNPLHRQYFLDQLQAEPLDPAVKVHVYDGYFGSADTIEVLSQGSPSGYNLVLLIHVLYYFQDPYQAVQYALDQLKPSGNVIIVHQEETGIPEIQRQHMMEVKGDQAELLTAEMIKDLLVKRHHHIYYQSVAAYLDVTECLAGSQPGIDMMSFCMECDLSSVVTPKLDQITHAFRDLAFNKNGRQVIYEPIGILTLPSWVDGKFYPSKAVDDPDPTEDYWQIACHYPWSEFLSEETADQSIRILDVACGTGRWLRALMRYVNLSDLKTKVVYYDLLDPNKDSLSKAAQELNDPFQLGHQYVETLQEVELEPSTYDLLWSMHGFYLIPSDVLPTVLTKCAEALKPRGTGFIALPTRQSFYVDFYDQYLKAFQQGQGNRFTSGEDVLEALSTCGLKHHVHQIIYEEMIHVEDYAALDHYIRTESTINSFNQSEESEELLISRTISLQELKSSSGTGSYLNALIHASHYCFPQDVWLIQFSRCDRDLS